MTTVYVLMHDDRMYDMGDTYIRGIYLHRTHAEFALVSRTPSGAKSRAYGAHDEHCCSVDEHELADRPDVDIQEDPAPLDPGSAVVPTRVVEAIQKFVARRNPYRSADQTADQPPDEQAR